MISMVEGEIIISVPESVKIRKFDEPTAHKLTAFMKAVDYVAETESHILFIEIKDPESAAARSHPKSVSEFIKKFQSGKLNSELKYKYRDTWIYEYSEGRLNKPILYLVLIALDGLYAPELSIRISELSKSIPKWGPNGNKWNAFVEDCIVLNIEKWNKFFPSMQVRRQSVENK